MNTALERDLCMVPCGPTMAGACPVLWWQDITVRLACDAPSIRTYPIVHGNRQSGFSTRVIGWRSSMDGLLPGAVCQHSRVLKALI